MKTSPHSKMRLAQAAILGMLAVSGSVVAAEYGGQWCGHSSITPLVARPGLTVLATETWGIETPGASTPKDWENAALHCVGYVRIVKGKAWSTSGCNFTDSAGDMFTGEAVSVPDQPGTWTFLGGTGRWKGIQGSGRYEVVSRGKPAQGASALCLKHSGTYTLPQ